MAHSAPTLHLNAWKGSPCAKVVLGRSSPWILILSVGFCSVFATLDRLQLGSVSRAAVEGKVLISSFR